MTQRRGQPINISDVLTAADLGPDLADLEFSITCGTALLPALTIDTLRTVVHRAGRNQLSDHPTDRTVNQALDAAVTVLVSELGPRYLHSMTAVSIREERDAVWQRSQQRCPQYTEPALPGGVDLYDHAAQAAAFTLIRSHMATRGVHTTYHTRDVALAWATPDAQQDPNADVRAVHYVTSPAIAPRHRRDMDQATIAQLASHSTNRWPGTLTLADCAAVSTPAPLLLQLPRKGHLMTNIFSAELDAAVDAGRPNPIARDLAAAVDATDDERAAAAAALTANVADWNAHGRPSE